MTIAGVVWGMLLLNEALSGFASVAFGIIIIGMYLVEPESRNEDLVIRRSFRWRRCRLRMSAPRRPGPVTATSLLPSRQTFAKP
ncbi:MAG: hypothetical protein ACK4L4_18115 [Gemmobacter sp.]